MELTGRIARESSQFNAALHDVVQRRDVRDDVRLFLNDIANALAFFAVHRQRLLAENPFALLRGGNCDFGMRVVRRGDIDHVDVVALDEFFPIRLGGLVSPALGESFDFRRVAGADGF